MVRAISIAESFAMQIRNVTRLDVRRAHIGINVIRGRGGEAGEELGRLIDVLSLGTESHAAIPLPSLLILGDESQHACNAHLALIANHGFGIFRSSGSSRSLRSRIAVVAPQTINMRSDALLRKQVPRVIYYTCRAGRGADSLSGSLASRISRTPVSRSGPTRARRNDQASGAARLRWIFTMRRDGSVVPRTKLGFLAEESAPGSYLR